MENTEEVKQTQENVDVEKIDVTLPSDILNKDIEDDDSDMPVPETADYGDAQNANDNRILLPTQKFYELFKDCLGKLPYSSILKNANGAQIKLIDLIRFVEAKTSAGLTVKEMNTILSFVANSPLEFVRPLMDIVESQDRQKELWVLK